MTTKHSTTRTQNARPHDLPHRTIQTLALLLALLPCPGCQDRPDARPAARFDTVLIVLGNEPLDDTTPTVDMIARVAKAVEFHRQQPASLLILTGGPTIGTNSEARLMADLALRQGVDPAHIQLEEQARTTRENASFTATKVSLMNPRHVLIVSKDSHLAWAMPLFRKEDAFRTAEPLPCTVPAAASIAQMKEYLDSHPENRRVRERLQGLELGRRGTD